MIKIIISLIIILSLNTTSTLASNGQLCPDKTGSWYDPNFNGEGVNLEQIGPDRMVIYWYHEWAIADFETRQVEIYTGGYFAGVITKSGNTWNGTFTSFKGTKGTLEWNDGFIGLSPSERATSNISQLLNKPVTWRVSELSFAGNSISALLTLLSPDPLLIDNRTIQILLTRLTIPDCWIPTQTIKPDANATATTSRFIFQGDPIQSAITDMRDDIHSALRQ